MKYLTVCILVLALLTVNNTQPSAAQTKVSPALLCSLGTNKDKARHEKGPKVGARVRELRKHNKNVDRALAAFERNGKQPQIDESESFTNDDAVEGTAAVKEKSPFRNVSYKPQDPSGYGLEVTVITTYEAPGEWQGTVIYDKFASSISGRFLLDEYVADLVIGPDPTGTLPDVKLEVSYEDGQAYLEYGNESVYQQLGTAGLGFIASKQGRPMFRKATYTQCYTCPCYSCVVRRVVQNPRVRGYVKCTWAGTGIAAVGCAVGAAAFAEAPFVPCLLVGGTSVNTGCAAYAIFST